MNGQAKIGASIRPQGVSGRRPAGRNWGAVGIPILVALSMVVEATQAQDVPDVGRKIKAIMAHYDVVGVSVAVVQDTAVIYNESFGLKDIDANIPLRNDDIFRIASISKSFTATACMQLVEVGKLSLDDDVSGLVGFPIRNPRFPDTVITLRMLLSHTSSLNDKNGYFTLDAVHPNRNADWINAYNDYPPGTGYQYCNLNYNLAGAILERTTGERFDQYVCRQILRPLGLYGGYNVDDLDRNRFVTLYTYQPDSGKYIASPAAYRSTADALANYVYGYSTQVFSPTGGMKLSAKDLARYMIMHMQEGQYRDKRLLSAESALEMRTPVADSTQYGLALMTKDDLIQGEVMVGHTGSAYGLNSAMFFHPQRRFGFVLILNGCRTTYTNGFPDIHEELINCLYQHFVL